MHKSMVSRFRNQCLKNDNFSHYNFLIKSLYNRFKFNNQTVPIPLELVNLNFFKVSLSPVSTKSIRILLKNLKIEL